MDKVGIMISSGVGSNNPLEVKAAFSKAVLVVSVAMCFVVTPVYLNGGNLYELIGIDPETSRLCGEALRICLMSNLLQSCGDLLKTLCISHGIEKLFTATSSVSFGIGIACCYLFVDLNQAGAKGYFYSRLVMDSINFMCAIYAFTTLKSPSKGLATLEATFKGLRKHLYETMIFISGSYSECLGFEVASIFIYKIGDINQISAYSAMISVSGFTYGLGSSVSAICRTRINILLGKRLPRAAKHFYVFMLVSLIVTGVGLSMIILLTRNYITYLMVGSDAEVSYHFSRLMFVVAFIQLSDIQIGTSQVAVKSIGKVD